MLAGLIPTYLAVCIANGALDDTTISKNNSDYISIQAFKLNSIQLSSKSIRDVLCIEDEHLHIGTKAVKSCYVHLQLPTEIYKKTV